MQELNISHILFFLLYLFQLINNLKQLKIHPQFIVKQNVKLIFASKNILLVNYWLLINFFNMQICHTLQELLHFSTVRSAISIIIF